MIHKALHPRDDIDRLYVSTKGGRRLISIEDTMDASVESLNWYIHAIFNADESFSSFFYIKNSKERLITATRYNTKQHKDKQNDNNQETEIGRKNCKDVSSDLQNLIWEELDMAKKGKP